MEGLNPERRAPLSSARIERVGSCEARSVRKSWSGSQNSAVGPAHNNRRVNSGVVSQVGAFQLGHHQRWWWCRGENALLGFNGSNPSVDVNPARVVRGGKFG